jgi:hypothetical protein
MNFCGLDVSAKELAAVVRRQERSEAVRRFANTAAGHKAVTAVMRKLLHAIAGMFRHDQPYDGARLCPPAAVAAR